MDADILHREHAKNSDWKDSKTNGSGGYAQTA